MSDVYGQTTTGSTAFLFHILKETYPTDENEYVLQSKKSKEKYPVYYQVVIIFQVSKIAERYMVIKYAFQLNPANW